MYTNDCLLFKGYVGFFFQFPINSRKQLSYKKHEIRNIDLLVSIVAGGTYKEMFCN